MRAAGCAAVLKGDGTDPASLHAAFAAAAPQCVVHLAGSNPSRAGGCSCGDGLLAINAIDAALGASVSRFLLLSSLGVGDSKDCIPAPSEDVLRPWLEGKEAGEGYLRTSARPGSGGRQLQSLILRSGPLTNDSLEGSRVVLSCDAAGAKAYSSMGRGALAAVLARAVMSEPLGEDGQTLSVLDAGNLIISSPSLRSLEPWESLPFTEVAL
jgi:NAD(P)H-binding